MRFIEQTYDEDTLDTYSRVGATANDDPEDGELFDSMDEYSVGDLDDYGILAVQSGGIQRYQVVLNFNSIALPFMVGTGSPNSFLDSHKAALMTGRDTLKLRPLAQSDLKERFTDFNGNPVRRRGYIEVPVQCGECAQGQVLCARRRPPPMPTTGRQHHATYWPRPSSEAHSYADRCSHGNRSC